MLLPEVQRKIVRLTRSGMSEAEICRQTGASRNAVRRMMKIARRRPSVAQRLAKIIQTPVTEQTKFGRCPTCGALCALPCKVCLTKQYNELCDQPVRTDSYSESDVIQLLESMGQDLRSRRRAVNTLCLRPAERKRYEVIHRRKEAEAAQRELSEREFASK
ncbi:MAG: sigma-70 region 4 domain-containing protein [Thermoguttaceae bacterium]|nr:sigma-70 region 4 domain-containing protein [Thermoguttaceae bacterium]MBR6435669.1 sigma-70 region 4 domain-containing protein [Thermoguttaceae bacterium]